MSCEHDCTKPPLFPRTIFNRPALPRIDYRIGSYADVRAHLMDALNQQPALAAFTHRHVDDPAIALLEADATLVDILTFYQSLYANEAFLRTAQWSQSVAELVRLGGYRLAPGLAGEATFALMVKGTQPVTVPAGFGLKAAIADIAKPVDFETRATLVAHPALGAFPLYRPRTTPAIANGTQVLRLSDAGIALRAGDRLMIGERAPAGPGATQLLAAQTAVVDATWTAFGSRYLRLKSPLLRATEINQLHAFRVGDAVRHFGHNAPPMVSEVSEQGVPSTRATRYSRRIDATTAGEVTPALGIHDMPLDRECRTFEVGMPVIMQARIGSSLLGAASQKTLIHQVGAIEECSLTWGMQSGASTMLKLYEPAVTLPSGISATPSITAAPLTSILPLAPTVQFQSDYAIASLARYADIRSISFHPVTASFEVVAAEIDTAETRGATLHYFGTPAHAEALAGRRLLIAVADAEPIAREVVSAALSGASGESFHEVTLSQAVDYADFGHEAVTTIVHANVVDASQGKTLDETVIGSGDARATFQTFALPKPPLTYLFDAMQTPAQSAALEVRVDGVRWTRVDTLFGAGPLDQIYIVREDDTGASVVQFGDGKSGARLRSGRNNVTALLRTGTGAHGPLQPGSKPSATGKLALLDKVLMPLPVTTGTAPESADNARDAAPTRLQSLGRLVSLADYEAEARMLPNVLKASASWQAPEGTPAIVLTVLTTSAGTSDLGKVRDALTVYSRQRGPARHPVIALRGHRRYLRVDARVGCDPDQSAETLMRFIRQALGAFEDGDTDDGGNGLFAVTARDFGQSAHVSQIIAAIQNVAGVNWVELRAAESLAPDDPHAEDPGALPLPAIRRTPSATLACPPQALLSLHARHLTIALVMDTTTPEATP